MAKKRRRSRKSKSKSSSTSIKSWIRKGVNTVAGPVAFWNQLSEKDYEQLNASPEYQSADYMTKAKISATASKHKMIESELSLGFTTCSDRSSTWIIDIDNNGSNDSFDCSYIMADLNRWMNIVQFHLAWEHPINPYFPKAHNSESVSRSGCGANGVQNQLGKTCLTLKGNIVGVTSNIGDESGNSKYLDSRIFAE